MSTTFTAKKFLMQKANKACTIAVFGSGAMGSLFAAKFALQQYRVFLIGTTWKDQIEHIKENGLTLENPDHSLHKVPRSHLFPVSTVDQLLHQETTPNIFLFLTKTYFTSRAAQEAAKLLAAQNQRKKEFNNDVQFPPPHTTRTILTLQNGLYNGEQIAQHIPQDERQSTIVLHGITTHGASMVGPGHVRHANGIITRIAPLDQGHVQATKEMAHLLHSVGFETEAVLDQQEAKRMFWMKLIVNAAINPLTAILDVPNGHLVESSHCRNMVRVIVQECMRVARVSGVMLMMSEEEMVEHVLKVAEKTGGNTSSMRSDVMRGFPTEIDSINGMIAREGEKCGVLTPVNNRLIRIIKQFQK